MAINLRRSYSFCCPECGWRCRSVKSTTMSKNTRIKIYQCINANCSMTFDTTEEITNIRVPSGLANKHQLQMF